MILAVQNIFQSFAGEEVLHDISFHIEEHEKVALTGINGCGKSTLLKIIIGELSPDSGQIILAKDKTIGYLAQQQEITDDTTIIQALCDAKKDVFAMEQKLRSMEEDMKHRSGAELDSLMSSYTNLAHAFELADGYAAKSQIQGVFNGLGFQEGDKDRKLSTLSGGQKTRVTLGKLLLTSPDLLLLDEPTNHLDLDSISWLETFLTTYPGAVLVVSHDRYFLDKVVTKVVEIENHQSLVFPGNYTAYSKKKAIVRKAQYNAYLKQQDEIRHQEEVITRLKSFNREKSIRRAESREKALEKMDRIEKPMEVSADMHLHLVPRIESGKDVLTVHGLSKSFGDLDLFENQDFSIQRGERVAIIGKNGTGKTTILKILNGLETPDAGTITFGSKVHIGYFDQEHQQLHKEKTIFQEISDDYPDLTNTEIRNVLAAFLFTGDQVFDTIGTLSGGEQGRVSLAKLMLSEANFLILDEPTNHLDIISKEILEDALKEYTGTVLYVSHDRYFINQTATRILELVNHSLVNYIGNYDYYLEKKEELTRIYAPEEDAETEKAESSDARIRWMERKEQQAEERRREKELKQTEQRIADLEQRNAEIDEEFAKPETGLDLPKCQKLSKEQSSINEELTKLYERWETLAE